MLALLSSLLAGGTWLAMHLWVFLIFLVPSLQKFIQPVWEMILEALKGLVSALWTGVSTANFYQWILVLVISALTFGAGYHYGWHQCIDWVHAHFRLTSTIPTSKWWKIW